MNATKTSSKSDADTLSDNWERLTDQLAQLRDDLSGLNTAASDLAKAGAAEGRERIQSEIDDLVKQASTLSAELEARGRSAAKQAGEQATAYGREIERSINRNPIAAVLIALGFGFLIGMLSRSRS
jgi:ElaB/YqjD/DUF883 family membrane-anchored ribosome-binding protein